MKTIHKIVFANLLLFAGCVFGQQFSQNKTVAIQPDSLLIAYSKTTNLIFPYAITSVDRGSRDVLAQKAIGLENILQIKAAQECFAETNLTVVTAEGKLYSFVLNYDETPKQLNLSFTKSRRTSADALLSPGNLNEARVKTNATNALHEKQENVRLHDNRYDINFALNGIFIKDELMYFRVLVENNSNIDFDVEQLRFFIRDHKKAKRTASQELEVDPLYILNDIEAVKSGSQNTFVFAIPKFTMENKKFLMVQLMEASGGRDLEIKVKNKKLGKAIILPGL